MLTDRLSEPQRHIPALDGLRGLAILGTVAVHILYVRAIPDPPPAYLSLFHLAEFGWMGVDLFFVLSGFLITGILLDTRGSRNYFRSFYARRTLRIFPLYYGVIVLWLLASAWVSHTAWSSILPPASASPWYLAYLQNWFMPSHPAVPTGMLGVFWTLAIEEQFYLVWPLLVFLLPRRALWVLCFAICGLAPVWRIFLAAHGFSTQFLLVNTFTRVDTLVWGALAALVVRTPALMHRLRPALPWLLAAAATAILVIDFPLHEFYTRAKCTETLGFTCIAIGSAAFLLMAYVSDSKRSRLAHALDTPWLRNLGRYSYGMYVLHGVILFPVMFYSPRLPWFGHSVLTGLPLSIALFAACWGLAWCSFHLFERRFLHFKRFFEPDHRDPATRPGHHPDPVRASRSTPESSTLVS